MITVAVVVILAVIVLVTLNKNSDVDLSADNLSSYLRLMQNDAKAGKKCCDGVVPDGYGIYFSRGSTEFLTYADQNDNMIYDSGEELNTYTTIDSFSLDCDWSGDCDILFLMPDAAVYTDGATVTDEATITVGTSETIDITINSSTGVVSTYE